MTYSIFLNLEPYLAQWFRHEHGGNYPVRLKRGSAEADLLQVYLTPLPKTRQPKFTHSPEETEVIIPYFKHKDIRTYNHLPQKGIILLQECIRTRFKVKLWKDLHTVGNVIKRTDQTIASWMEKNGIEVDDRNWNTIAKILQRKRAVYTPNGRLTNHKSSKHRKKSSQL